VRIEDLAREAGMSVRGLGKAFKRQYGLTPHQYLVRVRVREAANLLVNSEASLEAIAEKTGFPNRHYLSRMFKKLTGQSPADFRHKHGGERDEALAPASGG
jgi:iron complex transport system substrate-binding protein